MWWFKNCNCQRTETVLGLVILVVTLWPNLLGANASWWVTVVAAALLVLHAWSCRGMCMPEEMLAARRKRR